MKRPEIILKGLQVKSLTAAKQLAKAMAIIEEQCGIRSVKLTLDDCFICSWMEINKLDKTPMEKLLQKILKKAGGS